ncbi:hypothetical protein CQ10_31210 [Bradyrhizobium valentinum]|nr:hypothetical protein CQ10_31210 [Bradyrhizobium valentinum]
MPIERSLLRDDEFRGVRTAQDRKITQALFVKPVDRQSEQGFARCANTNRSSRLQLAQGAADADAFLVAKQG